MPRDLIERHAAVRILVYAAAVVAVLFAVGMAWGVVAHYASVILVLFLAWIIAFALQPLAAMLQRRGVPRLLSVVLVYLALFAVATGVILLAIPGLRAQAEHLGRLLSAQIAGGGAGGLAGWVAHLLQGLGFSSRDAHELITQAARQIQAAANNLGGQALAAAQSLFGEAVSLIFNATLVAILSFYMMLDGGALVERLLTRLPPKWVPDVRLFQKHVDTIFGGFLRAALVITASYAALNWLVLAAFGQPGAVIFAVLAGMLLVVPWIGAVLAIIPPMVPVLLSSPSSVVLRNLVILVIALVIAQQVIMQIVAPRVISAHVGMHPLLVFVALLVGGHEAGVWGVLFGPPVAAVVVAMLDTFIERWHRSRGTSIDAGISPQGGIEAVGAADGSPRVEDDQLADLRR